MRCCSTMPVIARCFASYRLEEVIGALKADESEWAATELATLGTKSPLSCKVSLRLMEEGAGRASFEDEMRAEYALAGRVVRTHDFHEGVRALLIDKDNQPQWDPATPEEVDEEMLDVLFAPLHGHGEIFVQQFGGFTGEPAGDLMNLPPPAAAVATSAKLVVGSAARTLVEARGWGEAIDALPTAADALKLPESMRALAPRPVYARAPDAKAKAA